MLLKSARISRDVKNIAAMNTLAQLESPHFRFKRVKARRALQRGGTFGFRYRTDLSAASVAQALGCAEEHQTKGTKRKSGETDGDAEDNSGYTNKQSPVSETPSPVNGTRSRVSGTPSPVTGTSSCSNAPNKKLKPTPVRHRQPRRSHNHTHRATAKPGNNNTISDECVHANSGIKSNFNVDIAAATRFIGAVHYAAASGGGPSGGYCPVAGTSASGAHYDVVHYPDVDDSSDDEAGWENSGNNGGNGGNGDGDKDKDNGGDQDDDSEEDDEEEEEDEKIDNEDDDGACAKKRIGKKGRGEKRNHKKGGKKSRARKPKRIKRVLHVIKPLYTKLLKFRTMRHKNRRLHSCCEKVCNDKWRRLKKSKFGSDLRSFYDKTDLHTEYFAWGRWKAPVEPVCPGTCICKTGRSALRITKTKERRLVSTSIHKEVLRQEFLRDTHHRFATCCENEMCPLKN